jgi:hypothetical protein
MFFAFSKKHSKMGRKRLTEDSFSLRDLGETIAKLLDLREGSDVEIQRNRNNPNELKLIKHPQETAK